MLYHYTNCRRNFLSFQETYKAALTLITDVTLASWLVRALFFYTKLFTGPDQFIIQLVAISIIPDLYFTLYCPFTWIRASIRNSWAGWGTETRRKQFSYVRKPDPREKLKRQGYFRNYLYVRNEQNDPQLEEQSDIELQPLADFELSEITPHTVSLSADEKYVTIDDIKSTYKIEESKPRLNCKCQEWSEIKTGMDLESSSHEKNKTVGASSTSTISIPVSTGVSINSDVHITVHREADIIHCTSISEEDSKTANVDTDLDESKTEDPSEKPVQIKISKTKTRNKEKKEGIVNIFGVN